LPACQTTKAICRKGTSGDGPDIALALMNISEVGAQLLIKVSLDPGQSVSVCLFTPGSASETKLTGRVVWAAPAAGRSWIIGVCFDKPLSGSALLHLAGIADS